MSSESGRKISSGTPGFDAVLDGGLRAGQTSLVTGGPGTGKTILALQFLSASESGLYIGFEERESELRQHASALGIDLSNVRVLDLSAPRTRFFEDESYTVFPSEEVEGEDLLERMSTAVEDVDFDRLVVDPLTELRSLLPDEYQFRRNISSLFNELTDRGITTFCTAQPGDHDADRDLQFLTNAAIELRRETDRRTLEVTKYRGSSFANGRHTYRIHGDGGGRVYPKLVPGDHHRDHDRSRFPSGEPGLDELLGGGVEHGSVTVISGPSGVGKTTTATQLLQAAAEHGRPALACLFEELRADYLYRSSEIGMHVPDLVADGQVEIQEVESLTRSPDEFAHDVRQAVEDRGVEFVLVDGVAGYRLGLRGDDSKESLMRELHALCRYLKRMGVTVILVEEVTTVTGEFSPTNHHISYLADNIVYLRYLEMDGRIEKAIGVLKKRYGAFENVLRQLSIDADGLHVGDPISGYQGLLGGVAEPIDGRN